MSATTIELPTPDGPMAVYEATPDGGARGAVIVIQEAFGVNDHIQDVTRRCADAEIVRYADAEHGFHCDARASYHAEAAADGWRRTLEWFGAHLPS